MAEAIPRISFSHYLFSSTQQYYYCPPLRSTSVPSDSTMEFEFDVRVNSFDDQECYHSSANELFADGKILPLQIKKQQKQPPVPHRKHRPRVAGTGAGSMNRNWNSSGNNPRSCHSTPKVKPDGHGNRKGNDQRQNKKSSVTKVNPILNVPLVDVFCLSSLFLSGNRKK
ncbi:Detected protein of unknown function [Hibiscus syriacus]|uniref:Uncharacterized protein n=2 Tax=Hibiscus syriacus TaxID=106335 RepID=A0A6A2WLK4_HIBSY|nr:Detected protein of unknown function [Hibiscus syriacus]